MSQEDYIVRITNRVVEIMYENSNLFPVVEAMIKSAQAIGISEEDMETYIKISIDTRIGLRFIARTKCSGVDMIRGAVDNELIVPIQAALVKSITFEYLQGYYDEKTLNAFRALNFNL